MTTSKVDPPGGTADSSSVELRAAHAAMSRLSDIVDAVGDAVFTTDPDGVVLSWNAGSELLFDLSAAQVIGTDWLDLHPPGSDVPDQLRELLTDRESIRGFETVLRGSGAQLVEVSLHVTPVYDDGPEPAAYVCVARDIGDRRRLEAELVRQTMHDMLTGLPNRAFLTYRLTQALASARRHGDPVAVLVVDLDQFKAVDDVHGHQVGDQVLAEIGDRLRQLAGPSDLVARLGGDEFALVCPGVGVEGSAGVADRLLEVISAPVHIDHRSLRLCASVGIAVLSDLGGTAETLLKQADVAVYEAKARGGSRHQVFDQQFAHRAADRRRLAADLYAALTKGHLEVCYQPVVNLGTEQTVGLEALARWHHPVRGAVSPATFIRLAEINGFVAELDRWVLERACRETAEALACGRLDPDVRVAVNLSARSLADPGLADEVGAILRDSRLAPTALILEVTETALLESRATARTSIEALRALGAGVFLDDFGTGYSSLSFLRELPVTGVKIDRSFVTDVVDHPEDTAITAAIIQLGQGLGLETVAEGVETVEQRDLLRRLGCATAQGFLWGAAAPMSDIAPERTTSTPPGVWHGRPHLRSTPVSVIA